MAKNLSRLFAPFPQVMVQAWLDGSMGEVLIDKPNQPQSALARVGKQAWFGFLATLAFQRYAMELVKPLNPDHSNQLKSQLPQDFTIKPMDEFLYNLCLAETWSQDLVANYDNFAHYQEAGLGVAILEGDKLVAGASSFASSSTAIEIEIDTRASLSTAGAGSGGQCSVTADLLETGN